ncbi:hypothetical protein PR202_gb22052 [Eleusine coracana subsp. coracana]|uniref:Hydroxyproline-rich glycoprotein family protein n=1 Tax=Eleusine coracana subsp. coracana TaxID=191504 RepID=A0AAV5FGQ8_ELECO|nr:hypothetical protein PR202_gb22052 [Eleusine coracana subsp. coracana]
MFGHGHHHHHGQPPPPPPAAHHAGAGGYPQQEQTFKIFCRADEGYCLTVRHDAVVLAPTNPRDECQHWFKDMRHSTRVKDAEGMPAFALVNRATGLAIKHSLGQSHPVIILEHIDRFVLFSNVPRLCSVDLVKLVPYNPDYLDESRHGGVHDGTAVVLWEWAKGDNQSWKILPWGPEAYAPPPPAYGGYPGPPPPAAQQDPGYGYRPPAPGGYAPPPVPQDPGYGNAVPGAGYGGYSNLPRALASESTVRIYCKADDGYSLTLRNGTVCLAPTNPRDDFQHWVKDMRHSTSIKDEEGYPAFALVNKVTGEAIKHSLGQSHPVMWTESRDVGDGFRCIRMVNNIYLNFDAFHGDKDHGGVHDSTTVVLWEWAKGDNQRWKIVPW